MKQIKFIIPILLFVFSSSCIDRTPYYEVDACFQVTANLHYVNETVYFVDCSRNGSHYEWDFDDGTISNQRNPDHVFTSPGTYQVSLKVADADYRSTESYTHAVTILDVVNSTDLEILVRYFGSEDPVTNCDVTLFDNEDDWDVLNFDNKIDSSVTNDNGIVLFEDLNTIEYFIDAYKDIDGTNYYSNYLLGYATEVLEEGLVNEYNIYVEVLTSERKNKGKVFRIKYIEKSLKGEHDRIIKEYNSKK